MVGEVEVGLDAFREGGVFLDEIGDIFVFKLFFERKELAVFEAARDDEARALRDAVEVDEFITHGVAVLIIKNFWVKGQIFFT